jgi:hypothetical protein
MTSLLRFGRAKGYHFHLALHAGPVFLADMQRGFQVRLLCPVFIQVMDVLIRAQLARLLCNDAVPWWLKSFL